jgi:SNF2 family DNA or RNA helicase
MGEAAESRTLYPFQKAGVSFLSEHKRAYLADEMGLGKTVQAIVAAAKVGARHIVVVCPASVKENWKREFKEWWPLPRQQPFHLTVVSYSTLIRRLPKTEGLDLVILDEAHYVKTPSSKRTKAALKLAQRAGRAWLLSGTPMPNDPREFYAPFKYLWPDLMVATTAYTWMDRYCKWVESDYGYRVFGTTPLAGTELGPLLKKFMLRRRVSEVALDLPPLRFTSQSLPKDPELRDALIDLGVDPESEESMSTLRRVLGTYKAPRVAQEVERELRQGLYDSVVILYHHHDTGDRMRYDLAPVATSHGKFVWGFDGRTPPAIRQENIDGFQQHGGIFLAQQTAAGIGITLTRASEIVLVEPSWSPSDNDQAIKRIHRIGQAQPCRARVFVVPDSLDEQVMGVLLRKQRMLTEVGL